MSEDVVSVYVTAGSVQEAQSLAEVLVEERLVACVNVLPGVTSVYRWEGRVQQEQEVLLFMKTRAALAQAVCERVAALHSYDVPCAVVLPLEGGLPSYLDWVREQTRPGPAGT